MKRTVAMIGALLGLAGATASFAQMPKELGGCWQTTNALETSNLRSLSPAEARAFLGRKLMFSPSLAQSGDTIFRSPRYYVRHVADADFADAFMIHLKDLGISGQSAVEIDIYRQKNQLSEFPGNLVLLKNNRTIIWNWRGVFFEATRCSPPGRPSASK